MRPSISPRKAIGPRPADVGGSMHRTLGAWDLIFLGIGSIMGTGVFVLTGQAAAFAGPGVIVSFAVAALCAALSAMCYAEMAGMLPIAGSAYMYAHATLGEVVAFCIGWTLGLMYLVGAACLGVGWGGYVLTLAQHLDVGPWPSAWAQAPLAYDAARGALVATGAHANLPAAAIVLAVALALHGGALISARLTAAMVLVKLGVVLLFLCYAAPHVDVANWRPLVPANRGTFGDLGPSGVLRGSMLLFFAYMGFDAVSAAAAETRRPGRDMPIGILVSLAVCATLYMAVAAVLTGVVPYTELGVPYPMALGARAVGAPWLETVIDVGAIVGLTSVLLAQLYVQPRILLAMATDGLLPRAAAHLHPTRRVPHRLTYLMAALAATAAALLPVDVLGEFSSMGILSVFATVAVGVCVQRLRQPDWPRHFRVPFGPYLVPGLTVAICLALIACGSARALAQLGLWMALGLGVYGVRRRRSRAI